MIAVAQ